MNGIRIKGTGIAVPEHVVTNQDMACKVDTSDEWIYSRTGIRHRHHLTEGETITDFTAAAAEKALKKAGISPEEIGACIVATITPDSVVPSAACMVQKALKLPMDIPCFDLNAACSGFIFAMHTMECLLNASPRKYGLVIGVEHLSRVTDWTDRGTCILFGDGAGAAVVELAEGQPSIGAVLGCCGNDQLLYLPGLKQKKPEVISMEGQKVFKFAVQAVPYCMDQVLKNRNMTTDDVDFFVFHQANARIIDLVVRRYHIPEEKYFKNIDEFANTSAASIPLVLGQLEELGKVKSGSRVLMVGFGGGLTWGGALVEFA